MKNLSLIILLFSSLFTFSQSLIIRDYNGNDVTNSTYTHIGNLGDQEVKFTVELAQGATSAMQVALTRYEQFACAGSKNYFCWTLCYGSVDAGVKPVWMDAAITLEVDSTFDQFKTYYNADASGTDGEYLYVLYDQSNTSDSSWVIVKYDYGKSYCSIAGDVNANGIIDNDEIAGDINGNGVIDNDEIMGDVSGNGIIDGNEINGDKNGNGVIDGDETDYTGTLAINAALRISIFPNPAHNFFVISNTIQSDKVELVDMLGQIVYSNSKASAIHQLNRLKKGLYFVKVMRDNEIIYTEKLFIKY